MELVLPDVSGADLPVWISELASMVLANVANIWISTVWIRFKLSKTWFWILPAQIFSPKIRPAALWQLTRRMLGIEGRRRYFLVVQQTLCNWKISPEFKEVFRLTPSRRLALTFRNARWWKGGRKYFATDDTVIFRYAVLICVNLCHLWLKINSWALLTIAFQVLGKTSISSQSEFQYCFLYF